LVQFLRKWLVPVLAALMVIGIALAFVPLTEREEAAAKAELSEMLDTAFARIEAGKSAADPVVVAEKESLLNKTRAVVRFLAHDDNLLATDALVVLCDQLGADRIDVANGDGVLIASSDEARIGLDLGAEAAFVWTMGAIDDPQAELVQAESDDESLIYCCVARSDIEGFVLLMRDDPFVDSAVRQSSPEALVQDIAYGDDLLFVADVDGTDGYFYDAGSLCLRKTQDGVTLIAARTVSDVFAARNAALFALAVGLICIAICGIAAYLLRLEPVVLLEEDGRRLEAGEERASLNPGKPEDEEAVETPRPKKQRHKKPRPQTEDSEAQHDGEEATVKQDDARRPRKRKKPEEPKAEDPFDQIVD
jgi:hypothetical protein